MTPLERHTELHHVAYHTHNDESHSYCLANLQELSLIRLGAAVDEALAVSVEVGMSAMAPRRKISKSKSAIFTY